MGPGVAGMRAAVVVWMLLAPLQVSTRSTVGQETRKKKEALRGFTYYVHQGEDAGSVLEVGSGASQGFSWRQLLLDLRMTDGESGSSRNVGMVLGTSTVITGPNVLEAAAAAGGGTSEQELVLTTIVYDNGTYKGTISQHGPITYGTPLSDWAVVGGTGDFRCAKGYARGGPVSLSPLTVVVHVTLSDYRC